ncbi:hypothetical protein [Pelagicoccus sp. SDUM812005]|nr:hypothetical protein [Pelagicoccus sp. SDUM812005]MDQ8180597.1 hypothetical protein [Pelagicoccus sp. SDUM812005]
MRNEFKDLDSAAQSFSPRPGHKAIGLKRLPTEISTKKASRIPRLAFEI